MGPRGLRKFSPKFFINSHLETLPLIPAQPNFLPAVPSRPVEDASRVIRACLLNEITDPD